MIKQIEGLYICLGISIYGIGNSPQEAYRRYCITLQQQELNPMDFESCIIYFANSYYGEEK